MPSEWPPRPYLESASPSHPYSKEDISLSSHIQPTYRRSPESTPQRPAETISAPSQIRINGPTPVHAALPELQPSTAASKFIPQPSHADLPDECRQVISSPSQYHVEHDPIHYSSLTPSHATPSRTDTYHMVNPQYGPTPLYHGYLQDPHAGQVVESVMPLVQPSLMYQHPLQYPNRPLPRPQHSQGMFHQASNLSLAGNVLIDNNAANFTLNNIQNSGNNFMTILLRNTLPGVEYNSADRNPPS